MQEVRLAKEKARLQGVGPQRPGRHEVLDGASEVHRLEARHSPAQARLRRGSQVRLAPGCPDDLLVRRRGILPAPLRHGQVRGKPELGPTLGSGLRCSLHLGLGAGVVSLPLLDCGEQDPRRDEARIGFESARGLLQGLLGPPQHEQTPRPVKVCIGSLRQQRRGLGELLDGFFNRVTPGALDQSLEIKAEYAVFVRAARLCRGLRL